MFNALVIGLGNIGVGYDLGRRDQGVVLTHSRALEKHPGFLLLGGVDKSIELRKRFEDEYERPSYDSISKIPKDVNVDVVVVATPTPTHVDVILEAVHALKPRIVLCEKPIDLDPARIRLAIDVCRQSSCELFVNYIRATEPGVLSVRDLVEQGAIRGPFKGVAWYTRGVFNNASHYLPMLEHWLGELQNMHCIFDQLNAKEDPEVDFQAVFRDGTVFFQGLESIDYTVFELYLYCQNGKLLYEKEGSVILWTPVTDDRLFPGYRVLDDSQQAIESRLEENMYFVIDNVFARLSGGNNYPKHWHRRVKDH